MPNAWKTTLLAPANRLILAVVLLMASGARAQTIATTTEPFRFAFSARMFEGINSNDAGAAIKVWADSIVADWDVAVSPTVQIIKGPTAQAAALLEHRIEAITVAIDEYWEIRKHVSVDGLTMGTVDEIVREEFLLLVRRDSHFQSLSDLRRHSVNLWRSTRTGLATTWMEVEMLEQNFGRFDTFWGQVTESSKLSQVVLPVFFGQTDACLVTRTGFSLMCELNPQLQRELVALAVSPPIVPSVFFFRKDYQSPVRSRVVQLLASVGESPAGQQTLTLFQQDNLTPADASELDVTCALLDRHHALIQDFLATEASP